LINFVYYFYIIKKDRIKIVILLFLLCIFTWKILPMKLGNILLKYTC